MEQEELYDGSLFDSAAPLPNSTEENGDAQCDGDAQRVAECADAHIETRQAADGFDPAAVQALAEQLAAITAIDPEIQSWADVMNTPEAARINALVLRGCTPADAYRAARFDHLLERRAAIVRRAALHRTQGRAHLTPMVPAGDPIALPPETAAAYRAFFPDWSEAQIRADYRKRQSG